HWLPAIALLDRANLRLRRLDEVLAERSPFVYPLELRWEFLNWFARGEARAFAPHVPPPVFEAARRRHALILLSFAHEARPLTYVSRTGNQVCAYDLIDALVSENGLPPHSVWFVSGNLDGRAEYEAWKRSRVGGEATVDRFEVRFAELFSYLAQSANQ